MPKPCNIAWDHRKRAAPLRETVTFLADRLLLGADTVLLRLAADGPARIELDGDAAHGRLVALLAVAGRGRLAKTALAQLAVSLDDWRRGERALAAIRLAFVPLPRIRDHDEAYRLFLAEMALDAGLRPNELLRELGYEGCTPLFKFNQNELRVPVGSDRGGQWTSAGAGGGAAAGRPAPKPGAAAKPSSGNEDSARVTPVLVRPEGGDAIDQQIEEKWRRLGFGESKEEQFENGHILVHPAPMMAIPPAFFVPGTSTVTTPNPTLAPAAGAPKPAGATTHDDEGPACPKQENDISNGRNPSGDEFEYHMSLRINPENPTPKQSTATPGVTSQAYFLPSTTPSGQISFDDCKQRDTPTVLLIPVLKPGALFEDKAAGWAWLLANNWTSGYDSFAEQVENQNAAVLAEGRGPQIYYCFQSETAASLAGLLYGQRYRSSHFLVCH